MRNDFKSNYLAHHGILGQKWGVRRYQNDDGSLTSAGRARYGVGKAQGTKDVSSAKGITKRLNDLDSAIARNRRAISDNKRKGDNYYSASKKAKTDEKRDNLNRKAKEQYAKNKKYEDNLKKGQAEIDDLLKKASKMGYDIDSKMTLRNTATGKDAIRTLAINMATMPFGMMYMENHQIAGTKYSIKDNKSKQQSEDGASEEKRARAAAKKAGLDQGDNWKVYRDAQAGDKRAQEAVKKWETDKKSNGSSNKTTKSLSDGFGKYTVDKKYAHLYDENELKNISMTKQKLGGENVDFEIKNYKYDRETKSYSQAEPQEKAVERAQNFLNNFNISEAKESIAKEYYDRWADDYKEQGVSRAAFKAAIKPYHVDIDEHEAYVAFDDDMLVGGHSLDIGIDPNTMKIKYHSMNG